MKKFECNACGVRICAAEYQCGSGIPFKCTVGGTESKWHEVKEEEKLPKLTAKVFDRPDCPDWAKYAAVDVQGLAYWYQYPPLIDKRIGFWKTLKNKRQMIDGFFDSSDWQNSFVERPAKTELPDWVKVDNMGWYSRVGYFKVIYIDDVDKMVTIQPVDDKAKGYLSFNTVCTEAKYARPRPFNDEEMQKLVGKVIENCKYVLWCDGYEKESNLIVTLLKAFTAEDLIKGGYTVAGKPCCKLEHLNMKGEWVE